MIRISPLIFSFALAEVSESNFQCTTSCSPDFCTDVTNESCVVTEADFDAPQLIADMECKQCDQNTASKCDTETIESAFTTSQFWAIYCNDDYMVAWSKGEPVITTGKLDNVPRPPGEDGKDYSEACVMRSMAEQLEVYKFPIEPTPSSNPYYFVDENIDYVVSGAVGMAKDGVPIYPYYDNRLATAWQSCESDLCNAHAGKGADYHYHGDPFGDTCAYDDAQYSGSHPPQIGVGMDGYPVHGRYVSQDQYSDGIEVNLDGCYGHDHGDYGYHYHGLQYQNSNDQGETWTEWRIGPGECWHGDITNIANFWQVEYVQVNYDRSKSAGGGYAPLNDNDADQLRPCCSSTMYYANSYDGVVINGSIEQPSTDPESDDGLSTGALIGIIAGAAALMIFAVFLTYYLCKKPTQQKTTTASLVYDAMDGNIETTNSA